MVNRNLFLFLLLIFLMFSSIPSATVLPVFQPLSLINKASFKWVNHPHQQIYWIWDCENLPFPGIIGCSCWLFSEQLLPAVPHWQQSCFCKHEPCARDLKQAKLRCTNLGAYNPHLALSMLSGIRAQCAVDKYEDNEDTTPEPTPITP